MPRDDTTRPGATPPVDDRASLGDLFRELAEDGATLVRNEAELAKFELRETAVDLARDGIAVGAGLVLAAVGGLALTTFLVLVLGNLLDGAFWAGALIVGILFLFVGGILARRGLKSMGSEELAPDETIESLKQDRRWLAGELRDFRREITS